MHPKLDLVHAQRILKHFDAYEMEYRRSGISLAEFKNPPLHDFLSYTAFRSELILGLGHLGVDIRSLQNDSYWQSFIQRYASVIEDCPLGAKGDHTELVQSVTCAAWPPETADNIFPGKRVAEWIWVLKDGQKRRKSVYALI